uniref:Uncharacterized protein n=1 Tax=Oryza sativa subsp. japonica TaxID=39947 RepID=Q6K7M9_ORYSJ|nr:hypothetical protein [Oryza sativa Japonica Group]
MAATWAVFGCHCGNGSCRPEVGDDRWAHGSHLSAKEEREAGWGVGLMNFVLLNLLLELRKFTEKIRRVF